MQIHNIPIQWLTTIETLRDIELEDDALRLAVRGRPFQAFRWCHSMAGEEYGKVLAWGAHPDTMVRTSPVNPFCRLPMIDHGADI